MNIVIGHIFDLSDILTKAKHKLGTDELTGKNHDHSLQEHSTGLKKTEQVAGVKEQVAQHEEAVVATSMDFR
ncbi:hypothetical protein [Paenibacillus sp. yr247]|uniref:hypothetical protein n=1 Tax=Paenibacillus sp. yr247 TaxID=1761880 RepID=UPI000B88F149|nr:hypothetical protein [Paenibacillus sp. yr247]